MIILYLILSAEIENETYRIFVETNSMYVEAVIAWLGSVGFHAFEETQKGVKAYISPDLYQEEQAMDALAFLDKDQFKVRISEIEPETGMKNGRLPGKM